MLLNFQVQKPQNFPAGGCVLGVITAARKYSVQAQTPTIPHMRAPEGLLLQSLNSSKFKQNVEQLQYFLLYSNLSQMS